MNESGHVGQIMPGKVDSHDRPRHFRSQAHMPKPRPKQIAERSHLVHTHLAGAIETTDSDEGVICCAAKDPGSKAVYAEVRQLPAEPAPDEVLVSNSPDVFRDLGILK